MEDILECCCGFDIHKETILVCLLKGPVGEGLKPSSEVKEFGTQLNDLVALRDWLEANDCHYVAMESTGIYWQPVYAVLEKALKDEMHLMVVNARHMKNVPGKKTDMRDSEWIATLLRAGLLAGSFVPERDIRDLRQYTRYRKALIRDITSQKNRIEKLLQSSGFRLSSFLSKNLWQLRAGHYAPISASRLHIKTELGSVSQGTGAPKSFRNLIRSQWHLVHPSAQVTRSATRSSESLARQLTRDRARNSRRFYAISRTNRTAELDPWN